MRARGNLGKVWNARSQELERIDAPPPAEGLFSGTSGASNGRVSKPRASEIGQLKIDFDRSQRWGERIGLAIVAVVTVAALKWMGAL